MRVTIETEEKAFASLNGYAQGKGIRMPEPLYQAALEHMEEDPDIAASRKAMKADDSTRCMHGK